MSTLAEERARYNSAADYAYGMLRAEIVEGRFQPGRRMREIELAEWLGISRTPTRQALSRLELEGLLGVQPRVGLVVSSLDASAVEELYDMRAALEGTAAAMAASHASARDVASLEQLVEREAALPEETAARTRHNLVFHQTLYAAAHNRFLMKSLYALNDSIALLGPTTMAVQGRFRLAQEEHARLVRAIAARDAVAAEAAARDHLLGALELRQRRMPAAGQAPL